ncbi:hypothetical protein F5B21DRAFT_505938 [Xylaria acuta]|nr:hypothetical protein F5B21DRAFT_505938 [Xylaria acuta]
MTTRIIENSVAVLSKFASAVDVAVSFDPVHAALPWAVVQSILTRVKEPTSRRNCRSRFASRTMRYISTIVMAPDDALRPPEVPLRGLKASIIQVYSKSQLLFGFATKQRQSKIRHISAPFQLDDVESRIHELLKCEKQLLRASDAYEKHCNLLSRSNFEDKSVLDRMDSKDQNEMLDWISSVPHGRYHNRVKDARTSDTCEWLLRHNRFLEWEDASSSMILWLQGSLGASKPFLTSKVINHIQDALEDSSSQQGFAFFYCNRNEEERRKPLSILQSYVLPGPGGPCRVTKRLQDLCRETKLKGSDFGLNARKRQPPESANLYSQTILVLDALDECELDSCRQILETIEYLLSESENPLKIFISSRPDRDIRNRFLHRPNIEIQATRSEGDIRKFVSEELIKHENWGGMSPELRDTIVKVLLTQSQGMFQWVFLQTKEILYLETETAILDRVGKLPSSLDTAYNEIYTKIKDGNKHDRALADNASKWVTCARKPLESAGLLSAIRLGSEDVSFRLSNKITESQLLHLCNDLLVLDTQRRVWRFSHLSVTEDFGKKKIHWALELAHCHSASVCLKLLINTDKSPDDSDNTNGFHYGHKQEHQQDVLILYEGHPLQSYARRYWIFHTEAQEGHEADPTLKCLLKSFLGSPLYSSLQYQVWYRATREDTYDGYESAALRLATMAPEVVSLFAMCRFSFYNLPQNLWQNAEFNISLINSQGCSLLGLAAEGGCIQNYENIMKREADVNMQLQYGDCGSTLPVAANHRQIKIAKFLVDNGADVNMQLRCRRYGSALAAAANSSNPGNASLELLIKVGADVNMKLQHGRYRSALAATADWTNPNKDKVKFLIQAGADVECSRRSSSRPG